MPIAVRRCELGEIAGLREAYREEMRCQIIHDSIHTRRGWSREYLVERDGQPAAYGSVAMAGPWESSHALYEFYVQPAYRLHIFALFEALLAECGAVMIETQTNARVLATLLHAYASNVRAEAILFEDGVETALQPENAAFRAAEPGDADPLNALKLDEDAGWVVTYNGAIAGSGGVLYHYNRPYGDIYMAVAEAFRNRGLGSYLVQELKKACRAGGSVPAARCNIANRASRRTLQKAGMVPCGSLIAGDLQT